MRVCRVAALALLWIIGAVQFACAGSQEKPPPPPSPPFGQEPPEPPRPPQDAERKAQIEKLHAEIDEMEGALKREDMPEERRVELRKRLDQKKTHLRELLAKGKGKWDGHPADLHEKMRRLEKHIHEIESKLERDELGPEDRKELTARLHHSRKEMEELRAIAKRQDPGRMDPLGKALSGTVTAVAGDLGMVVISLGRDAGVREGDEFTVFRGNMFVGKIAVDRVDRAWSSGRLVLKGKEEPRVGDGVSRNALAGPHGMQDPRHGPPPDPELHKIQVEAQELEHQAHQIAGKLRKAPADDAKAREELKGLLVNTVVKLFDLREKARAREVEMLRKRLDELTQMLDKRKANRDAIIEKRVKQLSGESDDLDW
jgi:hypothetical protein